MRTSDYIILGSIAGLAIYGATRTTATAQARIPVPAQQDADDKQLAQRNLAYAGAGGMAIAYAVTRYL